MTFESSGAGSMGPEGEKELRVHRLRFDTSGKAGLIGLHITNVIFMILTLMVYRFWALTRVRRAIWPRMRLDNSPLEYTGNGLEIFIGFLKVFFIFLLPYSLLYNWVQLSILTPPHSPALVWLSFLLIIPAGFFIAAAQFLAYRYRVNRTQWRGIRGTVGGKAYEYGLLALWAYFVTGITLGIMKPWADVKLFGYRVESTFVGGKPVQFVSTASGLWKPYLILVGCVIATYAAMIWIVASQAGMTLAIQMMSDNTETSGTPIPASVTFWAGVCALIVLLIGSALAYFNYRATFYRLMSDRIAIGDAGPKFGAGMFDFARLVIGNGLILMFSIGLLYPLVWLRNGSFLARHLIIVGDLDEENFVQAEFDTETSGEGFIGDFDLA